jgi:hypothetical protein
LILDGLYIFAFFNAIVVDGKYLSQRLVLRTNLSENTKLAKTLCVLRVLCGKKTTFFYLFSLLLFDNVLKCLLVSQMANVSRSRGKAFPASRWKFQARRL